MRVSRKRWLLGPYDSASKAVEKVEKNPQKKDAFKDAHAKGDHHKTPEDLLLMVSRPEFRHDLPIRS